MFSNNAKRAGITAVFIISALTVGATTNEAATENRKAKAKAITALTGTTVKIGAEASITAGKAAYTTTMAEGRNWVTEINPKKFTIKSNMNPNTTMSTKPQIIIKIINCGTFP